MTRHLSDKPRSRAGARVREYLRQDRAAGLHPAIRSLLSRPAGSGDAARQLREFARIERGRLV